MSEQLFVPVSWTKALTLILQQVRFCIINTPSLEMKGTFDKPIDVMEFQETEAVSIGEKHPTVKFMWIYRFFIVKLNRVETLATSHIVFGKVYIPVSDHNKEASDNFLKMNFI